MENEENKSTTPPPIPDKFKVEAEWAEKLKIKFDPEQIATPPATPTTETAANPQEIASEEKEQNISEPETVENQTTENETPKFEEAQPQLPPRMESVAPPYVNIYTAFQTPNTQQPMPKTFMVWSILATIFCCMPAGIIAIINSAMVSSKYFAKDYEGAKRASHNAEIWIIVSIVAGIIVNAIYTPLTLLLTAGHV